MATETTWSTASTTLTDRLQHPVKEFLAECGVDVSSFPKISLLVETSEAIFKNTQVYIPLRIPGRPGVIFETHCRILRVTELPSLHSLEHRRFVEIEWVIEEDPLLEAEHHAVFSFLSGEVECPSCKSLFTPEPSILDDRSVKVSCHNCLHYWTIKVDSPSLNLPKMRLITDSFYKDPSKIQKSLAEWDASSEKREDETYQQYFPINFETLSVEASLEILFGERQAFKVRSGSLNNDFEVLSKSLLNLLAFYYFRRPVEPKYASKLEQTDICRKSDVQFKEEQRRKLHAEFFPNREFETIKTKPSESPFGGLHFGDTAVKEMKWASPYVAKESGKSRWAALSAVAASLLLLGGVGAYFLAQRDSGSQDIVAQQTLEAPTPQVDKVLPDPKPTPALPPKAEPVVTKAKVVEPVAKDEPTAAVAAIEKEIKVETPPPAKEVKVEVEPVPPVDGRNLAKLALVDAGYRQGMLHLKLQQAKEAAAEFEKVIELDPKHMESYRNLGLAYVYDRRFEDAIGAFETYLSLAGNSEDRTSVEELLTTLKDRVSLSEAPR